jgi:hypothetical protein
MVGSGSEEKGSSPDCLSARLNLQISWLTQLLCWMSPHGVPWLCVCQPPVYPEPGSEPLLTHFESHGESFSALEGLAGSLNTPLWYESDSAEPFFFGSRLSLYMLYLLVLCGCSAHIELLFIVFLL